MHNCQKQLPYCTYKQDRVLGDHSQLSSEILQPNRADVHLINEDGATGWLHQAEQGHSQRRLAWVVKARAGQTSAYAPITSEYLVQGMFNAVETLREDGRADRNTPLWLTCPSLRWLFARRLSSESRFTRMVLI